LHFTRRGIEYKFVHSDELISGLLDALPDAAPNPYLNQNVFTLLPVGQCAQEFEAPTLMTHFGSELLDPFADEDYILPRTGGLGETLIIYRSQTFDQAAYTRNQ
jgi:hypothetical protein